MVKTPYRTVRSVKSAMIAYVFLFLGVLLTGLLPQYLDHLVVEDSIELAENMEDESQQEKKESKKETDSYKNELLCYSILSAANINNPYGHFHNWQNPSTDIITPPPEHI